MRLLLDSPLMLWWLGDDARLSASARAATVNPRSVVHVSAATLWEIAIKAALGRIDTGGADLTEGIAANGFVELPISARHAAEAGALPRHHDDPFDPMLIAQARAEELVLITRDHAFGAYEVALHGDEGGSL